MYKYNLMKQQMDFIISNYPLLLEKLFQLDLSSSHIACPYKNITSYFKNADLKKEVLEKGYDLERLSKCEFSLLHIATYLNRIDKMEELLKRGCDPNIATSTLNITPLHLAARFGWNEASKLLLSQENIDCNAFDESGNIPLHLAARFNHIELVKDLLKKEPSSVVLKDKSGRSALFYAAASGSFESAQITKILLDHGAFINSFDQSNNIPLHVAVAYGHVDTIRELLLQGADINACNTSGGDTPLHWFVRQRAKPDCLVVIGMLLHNGADWKAFDVSKNTALHYAVALGRLELVRALLDWHKDNPEQSIPELLKEVNRRLENDKYVCLKNHLGQTPLHLAAGFGHNEIMELLLSTTFQLDIQDNDGNTPLHYAVHFGKTRIIELILEKFADPKIQQIKNNKEMSPLELAISEGNIEAADILRKSSLDVNMIGNKNEIRSKRKKR